MTALPSIGPSVTISLTPAGAPKAAGQKTDRSPRTTNSAKHHPNDPAQRTEWNVRDSDGTVIFSLSPSLAGGTLHTLECARRLQKPWCHLWRGKPDPVSELQRFLEDHAITKLNIAGPRASEEPEAATFAAQILEAALLAG